MSDESRGRGRRAQHRGLLGELSACEALEADGFEVLGRRLRSPAGEIDLVARRGGLVVLVEVKARRSLTEAAFAITPSQARRLLQAGHALLAIHPEWAAGDVRFDVLLVDAAGTVRRITDALRDI